jgi:hypothetical protein
LTTWIRAPSNIGFFQKGRAAMSQCFKLRFCFIAAALWLSAAGAALAQQFPTVPDRTVIGRIGTGSSSGPSQAIPFATLLTNLASPLPILNGGTGGVTAATAFANIVQAPSLSNCTLTASVASNNLTVALKDATGANPSASSPCVISFRNATAATGTYTSVTVTAATSFTANASSTFGTTNNTPFRLWVTAWNNAGTVVLGVSNHSTAAGTFPLRDHMLPSSTACNACSTATAAGTFYTTAAQSALAIRILGYLEWGSGLATAGTWASAPTIIQNFGPGIAKPGEILGCQGATSGTQSSTASSAWSNSSLTVSMTPTSAVNLFTLSSTTTGDLLVTGIKGFTGILRGGTLLGTSVFMQMATGDNLFALPMSNFAMDRPLTTGATTWALGIRNSDNASTFTVNLAAGADAGGTMTVCEIQG